MMKPNRIIALAVFCATWFATAESSPDDVAGLLSGGDYVPSLADLEGVAGDFAEDDLLDIAEAPAGTIDDGLRLRAIAALSMYPSDASRASLEAVIEENRTGDGVETLYLRAAVSSYAETAKASSVDTIAPLLAHADRDVRAATARALATSESVSAIPLLRNRLGKEDSAQVRLAISAAIRELSGIPLPTP